MRGLIVHISEVDITLEGGMGRIEYYWKQAFEQSGADFIHIGPREIGPVLHKGLAPYKAYRLFKKLKLKPSAIIAHEPFSGPFAHLRCPKFIESHGIERRFWEEQIVNNAEHKISLKTKLLFPIWRLHNADKGLRKFDKLMLSNREDEKYAADVYKRTPDDILLFKNGIYLSKNKVKKAPGSTFTIIYNASWIERKGKNILVAAAEILYAEGLEIKYLLIGTQVASNSVLDDWPPSLHNSLEIISAFKQEEEGDLLDRAHIFVLPSYYEGQPLSLLQAMGRGLCCITTNCCGQKDVIEHGTSGLLFNTGDAEGLARLIKQCMQSPELCERLGKNAGEFASTRSWENSAGEVRDYIFNNSNTRI